MKGSMRRVLGVTIVLALLLSVSSVARAQLVLSLTSAGAGSVTIPPGYDWTNVTVQCWGGGGGGGGGLVDGPVSDGGGGGGGGAFSAKSYATPLAAGASYTYYIGTGGSAGVAGYHGVAVPTSGGNGESTIWNYLGAQDIIAGGGTGGESVGNAGVGGTVGTGMG